MTNLKHGNILFKKIATTAVSAVLILTITASVILLSFAVFGGGADNSAEYISESNYIYTPDIKNDTLSRALLETIGGNINVSDICERPLSQKELTAIAEEAAKKAAEAAAKKAAEEAARKAAEAAAKKAAEEAAKKAAEAAAKKAAEDAAKNNFPSNAAISTQKTLGGSSFTYYRQDWPEYVNVKYGNYTIGSHGCGPTNMAMIISTLTGQTVTPTTLAQYAQSRGMIGPTGTYHSFIDSVANAYGLKITKISKNNHAAVVAALNSGKLIMTSMGPGIFTRGGHFVTYRGVTADGKILIADSISYDRSIVSYTASYLASQSKVSEYWVFEKK